MKLNEFAQSPSDILAQVPLAMLDNDYRQKFLDGATGYREIMRDKTPSEATVLWHFKQLQDLIVLYINHSVEKAYKKAKSDKTENQHTVPDFANKSLGKQFSSRTQEIICNQLVTFPNGLKSIKGNYNYKTRRWELSSTPNKNISVFQNIYDLEEGDIPPKLVECFLAVVENDTSSIVQRLAQDPSNARVTWAERIVLSCYAVLQSSRTSGWKQNMERGMKNLVKMSRMIDPTMTEEEAKQNAINQLGVEWQDFGFSVLHSLDLERINIFFAREWNFLYAPDGLVTSLYPLGSLDADRWYMFSGGIIHPTHLMFPLGRNLLWVLSADESFDPSLINSGLELTSEENHFVNQLFSIKMNEVYCHPDDAEKIFSSLYRTDVINYYSSRTSWEVNEEDDPYKIALAADLFHATPNRWNK